MTARPEIATVRIEDFRRVVGAAPGELEALLKTGAIRRAAPDRVPLIEATRTFIAFVKTQAKDASASAAQADARAARAEAAELILKVQQRELIRDEEADAALLAVVGAVLQTLAGLSARVSRDRSDRAMIENVLRDAQAAVAEELAALTFSPSPPSTSAPERPVRAQNQKGGD